LTLDTEITATQREYLSMVRSSADALLLVINDILDFSKIEAGKLELYESAFSLREMLMETVKTMTLRAEQKGLEVVCDVRPDVPEALVGDMGRLRQIVVNLLGNAIKFTATGTIRVTVARTASSAGVVRLQFSVTDTGIGIAPDKLDHIFKAFSQADGSTTRQYGGTGLGLTISSRLVELMGGSIWVESELGRGSEFHFTCNFAPQIVALASPLMPKVLPRDTHYCELNILVAEDNAINQKLAVTLLEKRGHRVVLASNGREAIEFAERESFDLIFMDLQMPDIGGFDATAAIRAAEARTGAHTPIVAMTAHAMRGDRERCLLAGMDDYLSKPIHTHELYETIDRLMRIADESRMALVG
jgi:CheY-like chemotaxis protein